MACVMLVGSMRGDGKTLLLIVLVAIGNKPHNTDRHGETLCMISLAAALQKTGCVA